MLDTIHGFDKKGEGELQLNYYATQLAYYNRTQYLAGFGYQHVELNLLSLNENRQAVTNKIKVPGAAYGTTGKNSVEYYQANGQTYVFFNQEGLYKDQTDAGYAKVLHLQEDGTLTEVDTEHFGDIRRGADGKLYIASEDAYGQIQYYDLASNRFYPGNQQTPTTVEAATGISHLPVQVFRRPEVLEEIYSRIVGDKLYEFADHLGNVHAVVSDRRIWNGTSAEPEVVSLTDYYPFGAERNSLVIGKRYRYGAASGQEKVEEIHPNHYTALYWEYDSRLGRRWNVDPVVKVHESPYATFANNPIWFIDPTGADTTKWGNETMYVLEKGDNLWNVEKKLDLKHGTLYNLNKDQHNWQSEEDANKLTTGLTLALPEGYEVPKGYGVSKADMILAGVGTSALVGETISERIVKSRSGFSSGKIYLGSSYIYSKSTANKINIGTRGIGWGLTFWSVYNTENQYDAGEITIQRRKYNHLNNIIGVGQPVLAIPIAIGDYMGQRYSNEIVNDATQPGGIIFESTKTMLEVLGVPTGLEENK